MIKIILLILFLTHPPFADAKTAEIVTDELVVISAITKLDFLFSPDHQVEIRLLQMDGSSTIALNPIYLFLVVTDNNPNGITNTFRIQGMSKVSSFHVNWKKHKITIYGQVDSMDNEGSVSTENSSLIIYPFSKSGTLLSKKLNMKIKREH